MAGCRRLREAPEPQPAYFPLAINDYSIYAVEELNHDPFREQTDTTRYWLRETIIDTLRDNAGRLVFQIEQEISSDTGNTWSFLNYGLTHNDLYTAQRFVSDIRTVVLSYPLRERKSWDANELNNQAKKTARYYDIDQPYTLNEKVYDATLRVDLGDEVDAFFQEVEEEIYARGIGLIQRKKINVETQPNKYKKGNELRQTIIHTNK